MIVQRFTVAGLDSQLDVDVGSRGVKSWRQH